MNGILCINKPQNFTSFDVIAKARGIVGQRKMGHAGTLDPMATGVLPVFLGTATRAISLMNDHTKSYRAGFRLGLTSDTEDIWGTVLTRTPVTTCKEDVLYTLDAFRGDILQTPPMVSALHHDGKRLYDLARQGIEVERTPRPITINRLDLVSCDEAAGDYVIDVCCSQGTYIRTLCADIGARLGCGAVMTSLMRTASCGFTLADCVTLDDLQRIKDEGGAFPVLSVERVFADLTAVTVTAAQAVRFCNGGELAADRLHGVDGTREGDVRVLSQGGAFLGVGFFEDGSLRIRRIFAQKEN